MSYYSKLPNDPKIDIYANDEWRCDLVMISAPGLLLDYFYVDRRLNDEYIKTVLLRFKIFKFSFKSLVYDNLDLSLL